MIRLQVSLMHKLPDDSGVVFAEEVSSASSQLLELRDVAGHEKRNTSGVC